MMMEWACFSTSLLVNLFPFLTFEIVSEPLIKNYYRETASLLPFYFVFRFFAFEDVLPFGDLFRDVFVFALDGG